MATAKDLLVKVIPAKIANNFMCRVHYSGKVVPNSQLHFGVFWQNTLQGVIQFGPSMFKRQMLPLVAGTKWNGFIELNRLAFTDVLPRNSESRALGVCLRLLKKQAPHVEWVLSYADACQCGDGTIYRATGFVLTAIKRNTELLVAPDGTIMHNIQAYHKCKAYEARRWRKLDGYQLRYIYFLNPAARARLAVPAIPYSEIKKRGVAMYKGKKQCPDSLKVKHPANQPGEGGAIPTSGL